MCRVPLALLYNSPFNLVLGDSIDVKVTATNIYGDGLASPVGSGANIVLVPDSPINFVNVPSLTNANRIGMQWAAGGSNGGEPILDYRIYFD